MLGQLSKMIINLSLAPRNFHYSFVQQSNLENYASRAYLLFFLLKV